jgi:hypothetical protein
MDEQRRLYTRSNYNLRGRDPQDNRRSFPAAIIA